MSIGRSLRQSVDRVADRGADRQGCDASDRAALSAILRPPLATCARGVPRAERMRAQPSCGYRQPYYDDTAYRGDGEYMTRIFTLPFEPELIWRRSTNAAGLYRQGRSYRPSAWRRLSAAARSASTAAAAAHVPSRFGNDRGCYPTLTRRWSSLPGRVRRLAVVTRASPADCLKRWRRSRRKTPRSSATTR